MSSKDINRVERKRELIKQRIISVAMKLFKNNGVDATTMEQISKEVDIAKGTLYSHFPVKEAIIDAYIRQSFVNKNSDRVERIKLLKDTESRVIAVFNDLVAGIKDNKEIFEKYLVYRMQKMISFNPKEEEKSGFNLIVNEIIKLGQINGEIRSDISINVLTELFEFAFIEAVKEFYADSDEFLSKNGIVKYIDLCINGIKNNK